MSKVRIYGDTSGYVDIAVPAVAGTTTLNLDKIPQADISGNIAMDTDTLFVDSSNNRVGIGHTSPSGKLHVITTDTSDTLTLESTNADATVGPVLNLFRNSASPAANDLLGRILFKADDSAGNESTFARIEVVATDVTNGSEDARMEFYTAVNDTFNPTLNLVGGNVGIGTTPQSFSKLQVKATTNQHVSVFTNSAGLTIGGLTDNGGSGALRIAGAPLHLTGQGGGAGAGPDIAINSSGNVGIGTSSPTYRLHVKSSATTTANFDAGSDGYDVQLRMEQNGSFVGAVGYDDSLDAVYLNKHGNATQGLTVVSGGNVSISHSSGDTLTLTKSTTEPSLRFEGDSNKDFVLTISGETFTLTTNDGATDVLIADHDTRNVGIGTNPASFARLDILGSGGAQNGANQAMQIKAPSATPGEGVGIRLSATSGSHEAVGIIGVVNNPSGNAGAMTFHTYNLGATIPERMRIDNLGNVGIGTTSVGGAVKLDVRFSGRQGINVGSTNGAGSYLVLDGAANGDASGSDYAYLEHNSSGHLAINVGNSSNATNTKMTIEAGGNVGIGDTNPGKKLAVNGTGSFVAGFNTTGLTITGGTTLQNKGKIKLEGAGTGCDHIQIVNDGNSMIIGVERSVGTAIMGNTYAYGSVIGSVTNNALHFGVNNTTRMRLETSGALFFPEIGNNGDITFPICSVSHNNSGNQYMHVQFQLQGGDMYFIKFVGYGYNPAVIREGMGGGYVYSSSTNAFAKAISGHCVDVHQVSSAGKVELVIDTGGSATTNRWGNYVFYGGTDTITNNSPIRLVQYAWNNSTARMYSS